MSNRRYGKTAFLWTSLIAMGLMIPPTVLAKTVENEIGRKLDEYLSRIEKFGFSGAVLVAKDGSVLLSKGYGLANRQAKIPFTPETVCSIGSITKQFTAAGILKLEMQGKLQVSDPINKYLPDVPADKSGITIHHLLTHSAGFRGDFGGRDSDPIPRDELVRLVLQAPLESAPGKRYEYSNEGYSLLGAIIERASGKNYEQYLKDNIFLPAGMTQTGYVLAKWERNALAHGYLDGNDWGTITEKGWKQEGPGWYLKANGGIHSTPGDMYKWHLALQGDLILSAAEKAKYFKPYIAEGPRAQSHYAYGWAVFTTPRKTRLIAHNGGNGVFAADFRRYVDENTVLYAHSNTEVSAIDLTDALDAILFGGDPLMPPKTVAFEPQQLAKYSGSYRLQNGDLLELNVAGAGLAILGNSPKLFATLNRLALPGDSRFSSLEIHTKEAIEAAARGDYAAVQKAFGGAMPLEQIRASEEEIWQRRRQDLGEFKGTDLLGTVRGGPGIRVYARLNFGKGSQLVRYAWEEGGMLAGVRVMQRMPEKVFMPVSATEFVSFSLQEPDSSRLRFTVDSKGVISRLALTSESGDLIADRLIP
jgi:CubicO group peptidase (beta-lactamase class C family)